MTEAAAAPRKLSDLANPTRFLALADRLIPWLAGLSALVLAVALWMAFAAPTLHALPPRWSAAYPFWVPVSYSKTATLSAD